jgi:hypothetical protein
LDIDYRGFGMSPGSASETAMDDDAEAAFGTLLERGVPQERSLFQNIPALKTALAAVLPQPPTPTEHGNGGS